MKKYLKATIFIIGLIPRCINYIFKLMKSKEIKSDGRETFSIHFSMLEIYQEKVFYFCVYVF